MGDYFLGIDAGTESIRASIFDARGFTAGSGVAANSTTYPHPGWAQQKPGDWNKSLKAAIRGALSDSTVGADEIQGVSLDATTCTLVFLDSKGRPLRDAIMWMDVRSSKEAHEAAACSHPALKYVGYGPVSAEWFPPKALWVQRNEPDVYDRCATILEQTDYLAYLMTGELSANSNTASVRWFYDAELGDYPVDYYRTIGLEDIDRRLPRPVRPIGEQRGTVTSSFAESTGLTPGTPVATGGGDAWMAAIGTGTITPGRLALITGSSHVHVGLSEAPLHARGLFGSYPDAMVPGLHVVEGGQTSTGSVLHWFTEHFLNSRLTQEAANANVSVYELLDRKAAEIAPGSEGLIVLDHWQGNRTPWVDSAARGVIRGLTLRHTPVHVYRAILEGVTYGTAVILRTMTENGFEPEHLVACGGATQSSLWMQLHADVAGLPIDITREQNTACLGSAVAAAVGADFYADLNEAVAAMVNVERTIEPDPNLTRGYAPYVEQYISTYHSLRRINEA